MYIYTDTNIREYIFIFDWSLKYGYQIFVTITCNGHRIVYDLTKNYLFYCLKCLKLKQQTLLGMLGYS